MHLLSPFSLNLPLYEHKKTSHVPSPLVEFEFYNMGSKWGLHTPIKAAPKFCMQPT